MTKLKRTKQTFTIEYDSPYQTKGEHTADNINWLSPDTVVALLNQKLHRNNLHYKVKKLKKKEKTPDEEKKE